MSELFKLNGRITKIELINLYKNEGIMSLDGGENWDAFEEELHSYNVVGGVLRIIVHDHTFAMEPSEQRIYESIIDDVQRVALGDAERKLRFEWVRPGS